MYFPPINHTIILNDIHRMRTRGDDTADVAATYHSIGRAKILENDNPAALLSLTSALEIQLRLPTGVEGLAR